MAVSIRTSSGFWDDFPGAVEHILANCVSEFDADGSHLRGYRSPDTRPLWIRDHTHQLKAAKYFDSAAQARPYVWPRRTGREGA